MSFQHHRQIYTASSFTEKVAHGFNEIFYEKFLCEISMKILLRAKIFAFFSIVKSYCFNLPDYIDKQRINGQNSNKHQDIHHWR